MAAMWGRRGEGRREGGAGDRRDSAPSQRCFFALHATATSKAKKQPRKQKQQARQEPGRLRGEQAALRLCERARKGIEGERGGEQQQQHKK